MHHSRRRRLTEVRLFFQIYAALNETSARHLAPGAQKFLLTMPLQPAAAASFVRTWRSKRKFIFYSTEEGCGKTSYTYKQMYGTIWISLPHLLYLRRKLLSEPDPDRRSEGLGTFPTSGRNVRVSARAFLANLQSGARFALLATMSLTPFTA